MGLPVAVFGASPPIRLTVPRPWAWVASLCRLCRTPLHLRLLSGDHGVPPAEHVYPGPAGTGPAQDVTFRVPGNKILQQITTNSFPPVAPMSRFTVAHTYQGRNPDGRRLSLPWQKS